mgnify:CR=1 FL=1
MKSLLFIVLAGLPFVAAAKNADLCASEAKLVESAAIQRDQGVSFTDALDKVRTSTLPDEAKKQLMRNVTLVYKYKEMSPDLLARNTFDACINTK